jgi:hypothetical protein
VRHINAVRKEELMERMNEGKKLEYKERDK